MKGRCALDTVSPVGGVGFTSPASVGGVDFWGGGACACACVSVGGSVMAAGGQSIAPDARWPGGCCPRVHACNVAYLRFSGARFFGSGILQMRQVTVGFECATFTVRFPFWAQSPLW